MVAFFQWFLLIEPNCFEYLRCRVAPPMRNVSELLNVKNLLVAIQNSTGANPIVGTIKPPKAGSTWLECLPEGWTA
jgi:hypothetical protein